MRFVLLLFCITTEPAHSQEIMLIFTGKTEVFIYPLIMFTGKLVHTVLITVGQQKKITQTGKEFFNIVFIGVKVWWNIIGCYLQSKKLKWKKNLI